MTWAVSERLNIPFNAASTGNFSLFARVFESGAGETLLFILMKNLWDLLILEVSLAGLCGEKLALLT